MTTNHEKPEVGDFISIPSWVAEGMILSVSDSIVRPGAWDCIVESRPDDPHPKLYRLLPGEFEVV